MYYIMAPYNQVIAQAYIEKPDTVPPIYRNTALDPIYLTFLKVANHQPTSVFYFLSVALYSTQQKMVNTDLNKNPVIDQPYQYLRWNIELSPNDAVDIPLCFYLMQYQEIRMRFLTDQHIDGNPLKVSVNLFGAK